MNGGTCSDSSGYGEDLGTENGFYEGIWYEDYTCECPQYYYGDNCERYFKCDSAPREIIWVVDGSESVGQSNYEKQVGFIKDVTGNLDLSENGTRAAFVQFTIGDGDTITEFYFQDDASVFNSLVDGVDYAAGFTLTGGAISHAHTDVVNGDARDGANVVMIVVTDGLSFDEVLPPSNSARGDGIKMIAVGIQDYDLGQLQDIASAPTSENMFTSDSFDDLGGIIEGLARAICG